MMGIGGENKYETEGGPSIASAMKTLRKMRLGVHHEMQFLDMVAFHVLTGNADAHGKNYSILYRNGKAGLAPVYDAVCTMVYPALSRDAAMSVGGEMQLDKIDRDAFSRMATEIGVSPKLVLRRLDNMAAKLVSAAKALRDEFFAKRQSPLYAEIVRVIEKQTARKLG